MQNTTLPPYSHGGDIWNHPAAVDFSANLHPLGMPPEVAEALRASVEEAVNYPDPFCTQLRRAIAHGQGVEAEEVICGAGASRVAPTIRICVYPCTSTIMEFPPEIHRDRKGGSSSGKAM